MTPRNAVALLAVAGALAACGGGGDPIQVAPVNAAAAWQNLYAANRTWTLTGTGSDNLAYTLNLSLAAAGPQAFPLTGLTGNAFRWGSTLTPSTGAPSSGTVVYFLDPFSAALQGTHNLVTNVCARASNSVLPPTSTPVGTSGLQAQLTGQAACDPAVAPASNGTLNWGVDYDSINGVSYFCTTASITDTGGNKYLERDCFETTSAGQIGTRATVFIQTQTSAGLIWSLGMRTS